MNGLAESHDIVDHFGSESYVAIAPQLLDIFIII